MRLSAADSGARTGKLKVLPIASSSKGNAYVVVCGDEALLIDCGVPFKTLKGRLEAKLGGEALPKLLAVLVTHNHSDHVSGLKVLLNKFDVPVFANAMTAEAAIRQEHLDEAAFCLFENGQAFDVGPFLVSPFSIPHDAADPVGYLVRAEGETYFHGTDIGTPLDSVGLKLAEADVATLESNHDPVMLRTSLRPECLKQRIAGPRGHLSNDDAASLVKRFASPRLRQIFLAHLSGECNAPHLALGVMRETLVEMARTDIAVEIAGS